MTLASHPAAGAHLPDQLSTAAAPRTGLRLLPIGAVEAKVGRKKSSIYAWAQDGRFPAPCVTGHRNMWLEADVDRWIEQRIASDAAKFKAAA